MVIFGRFTHELPFAETCRVSDLRPLDFIYWTSECVGDEIFVDILLTCSYQPDHSVNVSVLAVMWEFEFCWKEDVEDTFAETFNYPEDAAETLEFTLRNTEEAGGDVAVTLLMVTNAPE